MGKTKSLYPVTFEEWVDFLGELRSFPIETFDPLQVPADEHPSLVSSEPAISVIVTTYNHEHCLRQALDSAVEQKLSVPFEILLGEDCSSDGTKGIAEEYAKKYPNLIRLITAPRNCCQGNLARLVLLARGNYIAILEGDDYWQREDKLQKQYDYLESHPDCSWSASDSNKYFQQTGKMEYNYLQSKDLQDTASRMTAKEQLLEMRFWLDTCTIMARREILQNAYTANPLFRMRLMLLDIAIRLECSVHGKLGFIPESLGTYRINILGTSACRFKDFRKSLDFLLDDFLIRCYYAPSLLSQAEWHQIIQNFGHVLCGICSNLAASRTTLKAYRFLHRIGYQFSLKDIYYFLLGTNPIFAALAKVCRNSQKTK